MVSATLALPIVDGDGPTRVYLAFDDAFWREVVVLPTDHTAYYEVGELLPADSEYR